MKLISVYNSKISANFSFMNFLFFCKNKNKTFFNRRIKSKFAEVKRIEFDSFDQHFSKIKTQSDK